MQVRACLATQAAVEPLARHHDGGPDGDAVEQVRDVLVEHANAAIRDECTDRLLAAGPVLVTVAVGTSALVRCALGQIGCRSLSAV